MHWHDTEHPAIDDAKIFAGVVPCVSLKISNRIIDTLDRVSTSSVSAVGSMEFRVRFYAVRRQYE